MANGGDTEEYVVVSSVRPGLKREFAFAWKSQADCAGSIGRRRARRTPNGALENEAPKNSPSPKRFKSSDSNDVKNDSDSAEKLKLSSGAENVMMDEAVKGKVGGDVVTDDVDRLISVSEDDPKSDVVDSTSDDEQRSMFVESGIKELESMGVELAQGEGEVQGCNAPNEDAEKDESEPACEGAGISAQKLNTEPGDGVIERAFDEVPVKRVTRAAVKVVKGALNRSAVSAREGGRTEGGSESHLMGRFEKKTPKKVLVKKFPTMLRELLETGLLEGLPVRYLRGRKVYSVCT